MSSALVVATLVVGFGAIWLVGIRAVLNIAYRAHVHRLEQRQRHAVFLLVRATSLNFLSAYDDLDRGVERARSHS